MLGVGTPKMGYVIRFPNSDMANTAKAHSGWLQKLGNTCKLVKPRFGVVAHRFSTAGMNLEENKQQVIDKIIEENNMATKDFKIDDVRWLKPEDTALGSMASLRIWFDTAGVAKWIEMNGLVCDQRYISGVEAYCVEKKRCHRCQKQATWCGHIKKRLDASTAVASMIDETALPVLS